MRHPAGDGICGILPGVGGAYVRLGSQAACRGSSVTRSPAQAQHGFGVLPAEMMVLEDSENGCRAAAAAGAFTVAVPADHSCEHDFSMASLVIPSLADPRLYEVLRL